MVHILNQPPRLRVVFEEDASIGVINAAVAAEERLQKQANGGLGRGEENLRHELVGGADVQFETSQPLVRAISLRDPAPSLSINQSIPVTTLVSDLSQAGGRHRGLEYGDHGRIRGGVRRAVT